MPAHQKLDRGTAERREHVRRADASRAKQDDHRMTRGAGARLKQMTGRVGRGLLRFGWTLAERVLCAHRRRVALREPTARRSDAERHRAVPRLDPLRDGAGVERERRGGNRAGAVGANRGTRSWRRHARAEGGTSVAPRKRYGQTNGRRFRGGIANNDLARRLVRGQNPGRRDGFRIAEVWDF